MTHPVDTNEVSIWQLLCRYCHLIDRGDTTDVINLFHPEGTLIFPPNPPAKGHNEIRKIYEKWIRTARAPTVWMRHNISTPLIDVNDARATAISYFTADFLLREKNRIHALVGRYQDQLKRHDDLWLFWHREILVDSRLDLGEPV